MKSQQAISKKKFLEEAQVAIPDFDRELVSQAWEYAQQAHGDQERASGDRYFAHPVGVARALLEVDSDSQTIAAALLHDVVEDTEISIKNIEEYFGPTVALLVSGVTKLSPLDQPPSRTWRKERYRRENLSKLFVSIVNDPRVATIKLADRLHNLTTLGALPRDSQYRIAQESLSIFGLLAEALGLGTFQARIQDLAFRYLEPEQYRILERKLKFHQTEFEEIQEVVIALLEEALKSRGIPALVHRRQKEIYSIYRKMTELGLAFEDVHDIIGIRIIVNTEEDCYRAKYVVDNLGPEVHFKDFIRNPRGLLGYQSLHKVILDRPGGALIEVQIRTKKMNHCAERGAAAHWIYKMGSQNPDPTLVERLRALRVALESLGRKIERLGSLEAEEDTELSLEELITNIRNDALAPRIQVFSPQGDIVSLPAGATPLDFAYHIHTTLGHECRGARVNKQHVQIFRELKNGDTVEIIRQRGAAPSRQWLLEGKVKSAKAKQRIRQFFRKQMLPETIAYGRSMFQKSFTPSMIDDFRAEDIIGALAEDGLLANESEESLFIAIAEGRLTIERLVRALGFVKIKRHLEASGLSDSDLRMLMLEVNLITARNYGRVEDLVLDVAKGELKEGTLKRTVDSIKCRDGDLNMTFSVSEAREEISASYARLAAEPAHCCFPVPGDEITGYVTIGRGLSIHRDTCPNVLDLHREERRVEIGWEELPEREMFSAELLVIANTLTTNTASRVQDELLNRGAVIRHLSTMGSSKRSYSQMRLRVDIRDLSHLNEIVASLGRLQEIVEVRRSGDS